MVSEPAMTDLPVAENAGFARLHHRPLARMNGVGNAIVVLDLRGSELIVTPAEARAIAAAPGLSFDQLMAIHDPREPGTDGHLAIYNTDGSSSGACGNGTRCVAAFMTRGTGRETLLLTTQTGRLACRRLADDRFAVDMGRPTFDPAAIPVRAADPTAVVLEAPVDPAFQRPFVVGMGNPHAVFFVPDVAAVDLARLGPPVEQAPAFPQRVNVSFAQVVGRRRLRLRVWERGAGATLGCGTGACATLVAAAATGRADRTATVELPGGPLDIEWRGDDHVVMTGPVEWEWDGALVAQGQLEPTA